MSDEAKTNPDNTKPSPELDAILALDGKFSAMLSSKLDPVLERAGKCFDLAEKCFVAVQEIPILRSQVEALTERVAVLERRLSTPPHGMPAVRPTDAE